MALTKSGLKILHRFKEEYGKKKGKEIFYKWKEERVGKSLDKKK